MCAIPTRFLPPPRGADAVVNLVGILFPTGKQTFKAVQDEGARHVAEAARAAGAQALVHVSAIGANADSPSVYARSKAEGEAAVQRGVSRRGHPQALGRVRAGGRFLQPLRRAGAASRRRFPLIGGGKTKFQPVFAGDVAKAVIAGLTGKANAGAPYELGGPEVLTLKEVMQRVLAYTMRKRLLVPLPFWLAKLQGGIPAAAAEAAAHHRPGAAASRPTMW